LSILAWCRALIKPITCSKPVCIYGTTIEQVRVRVRVRVSIDIDTFGRGKYDEKAWQVVYANTRSRCGFYTSNNPGFMVTKDVTKFEGVVVIGIDDGVFTNVGVLATISV
jgi:hypothetical protein